MPLGKRAPGFRSETTLYGGRDGRPAGPSFSVAADPPCAHGGVDPEFVAVARWSNVEVEGPRIPRRMPAMTIPAAAARLFTRQEQIALSMPWESRTLAGAGESGSVGAFVVDSVQLSERRKLSVGVASQSKLTAVTHGLMHLYVVLPPGSHESRRSIGPIPAKLCLLGQLLAVGS